MILPDLCRTERLEKSNFRMIGILLGTGANDQRAGDNSREITTAFQLGLKRFKIHGLKISQNICKTNPVKSKMIGPASFYIATVNH